MTLLVSLFRFIRLVKNHLSMNKANRIRGYDHDHSLLRAIISAYLCPKNEEEKRLTKNFLHIEITHAGTELRKYQFFKMVRSSLQKN